MGTLNGVCLKAAAQFDRSPGCAVCTVTQNDDSGALQIYIREYATT